ncbi:methyltransferase [Altererythrobacter sp. B11]|uniref:O-methyltransferase n=1 Tax=Altererythrobacter sp. B11 TaxID=2060312 RepID=UPI000DC6E9F4|nr:class I SAM-dependent methyltransferase [Altererythrobacter sp. B11]BBC74016.1 methyltransferase [Altererythrobacter sp. B11]
MNTISSAPVAPLLDQLFREAEASSPLASPAFEALSTEDRIRLMRSKEDYLDLYTSLKDFALPVSRETGQLLYILARATRARSIVEFGTSFGLSTLHLAAALRDNGGGRLITSEFEPSKVAIAKTNFAAAGLSDLVELREGDALTTLSHDLPATIDLLLLDGAKSLYSDVLALVEDRLRPGAVIVADNADYCPDYLEHVSSVTNGYYTMSFTDDVELSVRL